MMSHELPGPWSRLLAAAERAREYLEDAHYDALDGVWDDHEALVARQEIAEALAAVRDTGLNADAMPYLLCVVNDARPDVPYHTRLAIMDAQQKAKELLR
jgi:hypothetical protein